MPTTEWEIHADYGQIRSLRHRVSIGLRQLGIVDPLHENLLMAISEYLNNLVEHSQPKPDVIQLRICPYQGEMAIEISDNGGYFANLNAYLNAAPDIEDLGLRCGQMGLSLVKHLFPKVDYRQENAQLNQFYIPFAAAQGGVKPHLVLIDDDTALLNLLRLYLEPTYVVSAFHKSSHALDFLLSYDCDLVLSDIYMPHINGLQLKQTLSLHPKTVALPFIFLTGEQNWDVQNNAIELGIDDYLVKPINKNQLLSVCRRVLQRTQAINRSLNQRLEHQINQSLQPHLSPLLREHFHTRCFYQGTQSGGGDMLLHFSGDDHDTVILADLMGHDKRAKFFSHAFQGYFQGLMAACPCHYSAAQILGYLSQAVFNDPLLRQTTITCLVVQLFDDGHIILANAGHPYPYLFNSQGITALEVGGMLPGLLPDCQYQQQTYHLHNQRLLMYTDGLLEAPHDKQACALWQQTLQDVLVRGAILPLHAQQDALQDQLQKINKNQFDDDTTFVLIDYS